MLLGKGSKPQVTENVRKRFLGTDRPLRGRGGTPLYVNFFPLTFWVKNSVFWVKNPKNAACGEKFLDFGSVKGGGGVPPFSVKFFSLTLQKNLVR